MTEIIKFETQAMEDARILRSVAEENKKLLENIEKELANPSLTSFSRAKTRMVKASIEKDFGEFRKQRDLMNRLMNHPLDVMK